MENRFLDEVEDNAVVRLWSEKMRLEKGDSLIEGYMSELWNFTSISVTQNNLQELKEIWVQWDDEINSGSILESCLQLLYSWKSGLSTYCGRIHDLTPFPKIWPDKVYSRAANVPTFLKKLINITGMSEQWVAAQIKQKGDGKCISWNSLRDLILAHPDMKKKVDVFALSIYGLVVFSKALGHVNEVVSYLFDRLDKRVMPVPTILAATFRYLNACRRAGEGRFIGCAQLLLAWFHSNFWKVEKVSYRVFSENYSPLKELVATPR
ncbi:Pentatricopeptide repeat-containing-like protein [Gossypium australe]|uniref:Pentatricopeptide repeat-containing-like protein n=1 Tax=Gossypium australe TaxID=47621 RepID=A0A5B6W6W3_9ROSI|nr:Pentatricopeptide repeat-containing-like protein [Gossypium australe]